MSYDYIFKPTKEGIKAARGRLKEQFEWLQKGNELRANEARYQGLKYKIVITPLSEEDGGGWFIEHPDLKGCWSDGETVEEAIRNLAEARESWIESRIIGGREIPKPKLMSIDLENDVEWDE